MKIKFIIAVLLINTSFYAQSVVEKFKNAQLNSDFTNTFTIQKDEIIGVKNVNKWIKNNPSYFDDNYEVSVPVKNVNWFYGATRNTAGGFSFVKAENIGKRAKYLAEISKSYQEFISVITTYSQYTSDFEKYGLNLINNVNDYKDFKNRYSQSKEHETAFLKAFKSPVPKNSDNSEFFSYLKSLPISKVSSLSTNQEVNITDFILNYKNPIEISEVSSVLSEFNYLASNESIKTVLQYIWNMFRNAGIKGDNLVSSMRRIDFGFENSGWVIPNATDQFVYQKLEEEVKNNVKITNVEYITSDSDEFERWKKQAVSAAFVTNDNAGRFLVYGNVENNSEFTLPLGIKANGLFKVKIKATGGSDVLSNIAVAGFNILEKIADFLEPGSKDIMDEARTIRRFDLTSDDYYLPSVKSSANYKWAILLDIRPIAKQMGVNLTDGIKVYNDIEIEQIHGTASYTPNKLLSSEDIQKQNDWQKMVQNGLPNGKLYDFYRNKDVDFNYWEEKSEEKREREREWLRQLEHQQIVNEKNSYVLNSENAEVNLNVHVNIADANIINIYTRSNDNYGCCYQTRIYKYDGFSKKRGDLIKEFKNEKGFLANSTESFEDNYIQISDYDYPLIVDVWYLYEKRNVRFSVYLEKGAEIEILPKK